MTLTVYSLGVTWKILWTRGINMFWKHFEFESLPSWSIDINKNGKQNTPFLLVDYSAWRAPRFSKRWTNMLAKTKCRWPRFGWRSVSFGKRVDDLCAQQKTSNMEMNPPRNLTGLYSETLLHTSFCCVFLYHASAKTLELPVSIQAAVQEVLEKIDQLQSSSSKATGWVLKFLCHFCNRNPSKTAPPWKLGTIFLC